MSRRNKFVPLRDIDITPGEVWVAVRPAVLPYHVEDVGAGAEGKARLSILQANQAHKDAQIRSTNREKAIAAYKSGAGHFTDLLQELELPPNYNSYTPPPPAPQKTMTERLIDFVKSIWTNANLSDF